MDLEKLNALRDQLDQLDGSLIATMAARQAVVAEIGRVKEASGKQLRDYKREAEVLAKVRAKSEHHALNPQLGEAVMKLLIDASLTQQEQKRIQNAGLGSAQRALILGGNGKMGRWFADFADALGFAVEIADPNASASNYPVVDFDHWQQRACEVQLIVVAAPISATASLLFELANLPTSALIIEIGSIKSPLLPALALCATQGRQVCSIHPMFGPDTQLLADRHVLLMEVNGSNVQALAQARELFAATSAKLVEIPLTQHDELIAFVLGLSHAVNIVFAEALASSGAAAPLLATLSSTTFDRQLAITARVVHENPKLYFEIQHLNAANEHSLQAFERALAQFTATVRAGDEAGFVSLMQRSRDYLADRQ